jgi:porphobilinogen synthase
MTYKRLHRYRNSQGIRNLLEETTLSVNDFIVPLFISETIQVPKPIESMPGIFQHSLESVQDEVESCVQLGLKAFILFGIPFKKDGLGSEAHQPNGIIQRAIKQLKLTYPDIILIADCCLCEYTDHGHCNVLDQNGNPHNDQTLERLNDIAISYAEAGVDIVAPSGMMDGMVQSLRKSLDDKQFHHVSIMSYAVKYASNLYGPFRDAADSTFKSNRLHHQLNPSQRKEALLEAEEDVKEGADFLIIKPSGFYLDIIRDVSNTIKLPLVGYQVSGEYSMLKHASKLDIFNEREIFMESFQSIKRSGASLIISYYAKEMAIWIKQS